jgi:uncharacterized protein YdcH (DUF465 family)
LDQGGGRAPGGKLASICAIPTASARRTAMTDPTKTVAESYPEHAERIRELYESSGNFNALCHRFNELSGRLRRMERDPDPESLRESDELRRRRASLGEELLAMMQQTQRV